MKNYKFLLSSLIAVGTLFVSCSDDDNAPVVINNGNESIILPEGAVAIGCTL